MNKCSVSEKLYQNKHVEFATLKVGSFDCKENIIVVLFCINVCLMKEKTHVYFTIEKVGFCDKIQVHNRFFC